MNFTLIRRHVDRPDFVSNLELALGRACVGERITENGETLEFTHVSTDGDPPTIVARLVPDDE
jgi:hypothetical protein